MLKILKELCSTKKLSSLYTDYRETNKFDFGWVLQVNDNEIAIQSLSPDGDDDGITVMNVENIFRVETDTDYCSKMIKLCSDKTLPKYNISIDSNNILDSILHFALSEHQIVSIELIDSDCDDVIGFIESVKNGECIVRQVNDYGFEDGYSYIETKDITTLSFNDKYGKRLMKLWQLNYKQHV